MRKTVQFNFTYYIVAKGSGFKNYGRKSRAFEKARPSFQNLGSDPDPFQLVSENYEKYTKLVRGANKFNKGLSMNDVTAIEGRWYQWCCYNSKVTITQQTFDDYLTLSIYLVSRYLFEIKNGNKRF